MIGFMPGRETLPVGSGAHHVIGELELQVVAGYRDNLCGKWSAWDCTVTAVIDVVTQYLEGLGSIAKVLVLKASTGPQFRLRPQHLLIGRQRYVI